MSKKKNLSKHDTLPDASKWKFALVVSDWNDKITHSLLDGARSTLRDAGVPEDQIKVLHVPGAYELPFGAKLAIGDFGPDAIICLGCVIKGETDHNEYINHSVAQGLTQLSLFANLPIIFGVLTPLTYEQAEARAGGAHGNKGVEAAVTAIKMVALKKSMNEKKKTIGFG